MKRLILFLCLSLQFLLANSAHAWSPLDFQDSFSGVSGQCQFLTAASDDSEGTKEKEESEEEEEPDCD